MLKQQILDDLKAAMKAGETEKRDVLRMLDSMIKNVEIEKKKRETGLSESEMQDVVTKAVKQRKDAAAQFESGGRADLAEKEKEEIAILSTYLPEQLDENVVREAVREVISQLGATDISAIGKVMGVAMAKLKGQVDGDLVRKFAEEELKK